MKIKSTNKYAAALCYLHTVSVILTICLGLVFVISAINTVVPVSDVLKIGKFFAGSLFVTFIFSHFCPVYTPYPEDEPKRINFTQVQHSTINKGPVIAAPNPLFDGDALSSMTIPAYCDYDTGDLVYMAKDISEAIAIAFPAPIEHKNLGTIINLGRFLSIYPTLTK